jgi:transketolase
MSGLIKPPFFRGVVIIMDTQRVIQLKIVAQRIRQHVIQGTYSAQCGHPGGSMSIADLLALLYFEKMNVDQKEPKMPDRDRFILSKGHCAPAYYGALAEKGFFPKDEIKNLRQLDSFLQGHPDAKLTPGVDACSGSLGQGLSVGVGMALAARYAGQNFYVYVVLGDGEIEEGQVWEAAMCAAHYRLDHLIAFVDFNGMQIDGYVTEVMSPLPIGQKFEAFGWQVVEVDGHDYHQVSLAVDRAKMSLGRPTLILMNTIKGKGVSFMERNLAWHGIAPNPEQYAQAMKELEESISTLEAQLT